MWLTWGSYTLALWATSRVLPGFQLTGGVRGALLVAAVFGLLNWFVGWLLFAVIGVLTLGLGFLFSFATHWLVTVLLLIVTDAFSATLKINGVRTVALGALLVSLFGALGDRLLHRALS